MLRSRIVCIASMPALVLGAPACAADEAVIHTQYLPMATISATVAETLLECPTAVVNPRIRTVVTIGTVYTADLSRKFDIKPKSGLLSSVSFDLELYGDGRVKTVNAVSEGAGGEAIGGLFKAIANIGLLLVSAEAKSGLPACQAAIASKVEALAKLRTALTSLENDAQLASDDKAKVAAQARIAPLQARIDAREKELTLTTNLELSPTSDGSTRLWNSKVSERPAYNRWLQMVDDDWGKLPADIFKGLRRFVLSVKLDDQTAELRPTDALSSETITNGVAYVQSPIATAVVCTWDNAAAACLGTLKAASTSVPQAAPRRILAIKSSAFGNRSLSASFDQSGAATKIGYKSSSELKDIVASMNGAVEAGRTIRDGDTQELSRAAAREEAEIKLIELRKKKAVLLASDE